MPALHALLISLFEYPNPQDNLPGCASDFANMKKHLQAFCKKNGYDFKPKELVNEKATRKGILDGYKHFLKANKGDTCLVYYTGHGYQLRAAPEFWLETDGYHEALYCYDAAEKRGVLDKELAHLGWKYVDSQGKNLHFVEIFDCCHSGGNTRNIVPGKGPAARTRPRDKGPAEPLSRYFGIQEYNGYQEYLNDKSQPPRIQPKVAKRIHLAAAKADETAKEDEIKGVRAGFFTHSLCEVLEDTGYSVSYAELMDRVWFKVKELARPSISSMGDQTPLPDAEKTSLHLQFGTGTQGEQVYTVGFDGIRKKWVLRAGATNGIPPEGETMVKIEGEKKAYKLGKVHPDVSEIIGLPAHFNKENTYRATIESMEWSGKKKLAFHAKVGKKEREGFSKAWDEKYSKQESRYLDWVKNPSEADYLVSYNKGYFLTKTDAEVPLFQRQAADNLDEFFAFAESVVKWFLAKELENPQSKITRDDLEIKVETYSYEDDYQTPVEEDWNQPILCRYHLENSEYNEARLSLSLTNRWNKDLYVGLLWLGSDFAITHELLPIPTVLHPGNTANMAFDNEKKVFVSIPDELRKYGVSEVVEHAKIIVSTEPLNVQTYGQSGLPMDEAVRKGDTRSATKRLSSKSRETEKANATTPDWNAFTLTVQIVRPESENKLTDNNPVDIEGAKLSAPAGFSADIDLASALSGQRAVGNQPPALRNSAAFADFHLSTGKRSTGVPSNAIQLRNVKNPEAVTEETPLQLNLGKKATAANERVVCLGYDADAGMYFPTGIEDENGVLNITQLPPPVPDGRRSLGGAVVLFLKKMVMEHVDPEAQPSLYKLRLATPGENLEAKPHYENDIAKIRQAVKNANRILVVTHGIIGDTTEQVKLPLRLKLNQPYDVVLAFDYENLDTEIQDIADKFQEKLAEVRLTAGHGKTVHLVAHSMGGLVSRYFIEKLNGGQVVSRLIMLGTPNGGSEWGTIAQFATVAATFAMNYLTFAQPAQIALNLLGKYGNRALKTLKQMRPGSPFLKDLNAGQISPVPYFIVAGNLLDVQADAKRQSFFEKLTLRVMKGVGSVLFRSPNDIAVSVANIRGVPFALPDLMQDTACDHLTYFTDEKGLTALEKALNQA